MLNVHRSIVKWLRHRSSKVLLMSNIKVPLKENNLWIDSKQICFLKLKKRKRKKKQRNRWWKKWFNKMSSIETRSWRNLKTGRLSTRPEKKDTKPKSPLSSKTKIKAQSTSSSNNVKVFRNPLWKRRKLTVTRKIRAR